MELSQPASKVRGKTKTSNYQYRVGRIYLINNWEAPMLMDDIERYSSVLVSVTQMASIEQPSSILEAVQSCYSSQALGPAQGRHQPVNVAVGHETRRWAGRVADRIWRSCASNSLHARASREKMARSGSLLTSSSRPAARFSNHLPSLCREDVEVAR